MILEFEWNERGDYALGVNVEYTHDGKAIIFQFELLFGNLVVGYQWGG